MMLFQLHLLLFTLYFVKYWEMHLCFSEWGALLMYWNILCACEMDIAE